MIKLVSRAQAGGVLGRVVAAIAVVCIGLAVYISTAKLDAEALLKVNQVLPHTPFEISPEARSLHDSLLIADWHTDSLMWLRDLLERSEQGQVDIPRLREGNVAVQVFTSVTRVPDAGIQVQDNPAEGDKIAALAFLDKWPEAARKSLYARAIYHADKMFELQTRSPESVKVITNQADLAQVLESRLEGNDMVGTLLGTEGLHALEGRIENLARLYDAGYRVMGLYHFFDNELGGSLHGMSDAGLTAFGKAVVREMQARSMIVDVAHASLASVEDILEISERPVILSHTGMLGVCDTPRNIPEELMKRIADAGGLIGIGYFELGICQLSVESVVRHIRYAIDRVGVEHVSLGSDYDGSVETPFDVSEIAILTQTMLEQGFSEVEIRAVMGENLINFLADYLPEE